MLEFNQKVLVYPWRHPVTFTRFLAHGDGPMLSLEKAILENQPGIVGPSSLQDYIPGKYLKNKFPNYTSDICTRYFSRFYIKGNNRYIDMVCLEEANIAFIGRIALHSCVGLY